MPDCCRPNELIIAELVYMDPVTDGVVVASNLPDRSSNEMLTITPMSKYLAGRLRLISQLQLRVTLVPIGRMGLDGKLVMLSSINGGTAFCAHNSHRKLIIMIIILTRYYHIP